MGATLQDTNNIFWFVEMNTGAFTEQELQEQRFSNFHDWTDYGIRFGLVGVMFAAYNVFVSPYLNGKKIFAIVMAIVILNVTFSTQGIVLAALLFRFLPRENLAVKVIMSEAKYAA